MGQCFLLGLFVIPGGQGAQPGSRGSDVAVKIL
jgi:hypothetical protein